MSVFKGGIKLFYLLLLSHKFSVTNSVDMSKIEVFIGGTALIWLESSVSCSDEFLSVSEMLKYIWSSTGSSVSTRNESRPAEVFLFETKL